MILPPLADESARSQFTQWANRSSWLYGCDLETEWRQAREEGRDLSSVEAEFERLNFNEPAANPRERLIAGRRDLRWFEDALGLIAVSRIDVVVTDLQMPGMCGDELIEQARALMPEGRFLLLCGDRRAPQALALARQGIPVLEKPCTAKSLMAAVEAEIRQMDMSANPGRAMR